MSVLEGVLTDSDSEGSVARETALQNEELRLADSMDSEDEGDVLSSALSTSMSAFSDGELQSAEVLAVAVEEDSDDELWEQLGSVSSGNINTIPEGEDPVLTKQELIRQIHLRRHVNQLKRNLADKEARVEELREQLRVCRQHLSELNTNQLSLVSKIASDQEDGNMASIGLLKTQLSKVKMEIATEEDVKTSIEDQLKEAELLLCEAQLSAGQLEELEAGLVEGEELVQNFKEKRTAQRLKAENRLVKNIHKSQRTMEKQFESGVHDHERNTRAAIERAMEAHEKGKVFLRRTLVKHRKEEILAGKRHRQHLEARIKAILSLKRNIDSSQATIQAQQVLKHEWSKKQKEVEKRERERILSEGGNPEEVFLMRKRVSEFEREQKKFKARQNERQLEIVTKLLEEEKKLKRLEKERSKSHKHGRQKSKPHLPKGDLCADKKKKSEVIHKQNGAGERGADPLLKVTFEEGDEDKQLRKDLSSDEDPGMEMVDAGELDQLDGESLLEPEIRGHWETAPVVSQKSDGASQPQDEGAGKREGEGVKRERSKAEVEMMQRAMDKLKKSAIIKQVAGGKEFKGQAFLSKPEEVVFGDFEVGKQYKRKLQLTNVSYSINYCRLIAVSDNLKDFVKVDFNPPGSMSAGLTCHMTVTFQPKLNEDIVGSIEMVSQTGYFSIPVRCLTKKCLIMADKATVSFGSICLGETVRRRIMLKNEGALPTHFKLADKLAHIFEAPSVEVIDGGGGQRSQEAQQPGGPLADKSAQSIMSTVEVPPSRVKRLESGLGIGMSDSIVLELKSHSVGNLSSVSVKSLGVSPPKDKGDVPSDQDKGEVPDDDGKDENTAVLQQRAAIQVGGVTEGEIPGFGSRYVELVYSPEEAVEHTAEFDITFSHDHLQPIHISASGCGIDLPVYIERDEMDLRICLLDQLYQDSVILHNRAATPFRVMFEVPPELQPHLEVVPKYGLIQGQSSFAAQLKFLPQSSILERSDCLKYFNESTESYSMPVLVVVADQTRPVEFSVSAVVTSSDLSFSLDGIDFGSCTVHESVLATLEIINHSLLPQKFGFVQLPPCVEVQPNDGFGQLLPRETLTVDVIFSAKKPKEYSFELTCKTGIDRTFKLPCCGVGVLPPLELSENVINFTATPVNDTSITSISVQNPRLSRLNSAVIRGAVQAQGTKMFEFVVPENSLISICPKVATISLGESVSVQVAFSPKLKDSAIEEEAKKLVERLVEEQRQREQSLAEEKAREATASPLPAGKKKAKKPTSKEGEKGVKGGLPSNSKGNLSSPSDTQALPSKLSIHTPPVNSDLWWKAYHNLLERFENDCVQLYIPCFVSSVGTDTSTQNTPVYRPEDTLYLEVTGPIVRPGLLVVSNNGKTAVEFGSVGTGDSATKTVSVRNISSETLQLQSSLLDPHGPFEVRNALRSVPLGENHNLVIRFTPSSSGKFYEPLKLFYGEGKSLELKLTGDAIKPEVTLSPELEEEGGESVLRMGHALVNDTIMRTLQLQNHSSLGVRFGVELESLLPQVMQRRRPNTFRACNYRAPPPFSCAPVSGVIGPNSTKELVVSFSPDHQSQFYADTMEIKLNGQTAHTFDIVGQAWGNNMYSMLSPKSQLEDDCYKKDLKIKPVPHEYMTASATQSDESLPPPTALVLIFIHHVGSEAEEEMSVDGLSSVAGGNSRTGSAKAKTQPQSDVSRVKVIKEVEVGCVKSAQVKKATGELSVDPLPPSNPHSKLFTIEPLKSSVEAGTAKTVTFTFHPPQDGSTQTYEVDTNLTLKGESTQTQRVLLRGLVCE